jgi:hypothetical protein
LIDITNAVSETIYLIDTGSGLSGNISINGISYLGLPTTFTCPVGSKFRITNDTTGKQSATCQSFSSQYFVSSGDTNDWVAVGGINQGVNFIP